MGKLFLVFVFSDNDKSQVIYRLQIRTKNEKDDVTVELEDAPHLPSPVSPRGSRQAGERLRIVVFVSEGVLSGNSMSFPTCRLIKEIGSRVRVQNHNQGLQSR